MTVSSAPARRVFLAGATGYIGRHVVRELARRGHEVVAFARPRAGPRGRWDEAEIQRDLSGAEVRFGQVTSARDLAEAGFRGESFDAVVSCLASRTGDPEDAWAIEHRANLALLEAAQTAGAHHFVLLSAICVQKPRLAFQHAKLAFEGALQSSGMAYSIVRPTAFFKSLAGQIARVKRGRPFLLFGDGERTACKPISEADLSRYIADCLDDPDKRNAILPVGGPGPAITPKLQSELLFDAFGRPRRERRVPPALLDAIVLTLSALGRVAPPLRAKAELARIGQYYANESMLVWDAAQGRYDADATPSFGTDTLAAFYRRAAADGLDHQELGDHAVFGQD